ATLTRNRTADESLSAEAIALCEALLMPDPQCSDTSTVPVASRDSAFEAKMSARRRDEFLSSYNFSSGEREEVMGSLSRLSSAEERSSTLLAFQADGETQTSAVVDRFAKHVDDTILKKLEDKKADECLAGEPADAESESDSGSSPEDVELDVEGEGEDPVDESNFGFGPVSLHSKFVKCKVCGNQEKVDRVEFPTLRIRLSCRTSISPMSENVLRLLGGGATNSSSKGGGKGQSSQWQEKSRSKWSSSWESAWGGEYEEKPSKSNKVKSSASDSTYASS
ncbi:unnamed protein product, partial [Polarella glacialis]